MFRGIFDAARRFYLLFQQHTTEAHNAAHPEFLQVAEGYHKIRYMGPQVAALCVDMRTRRSAAQIMPEVGVLRRFGVDRFKRRSCPRGVLQWYNPGLRAV